MRVTVGGSAPTIPGSALSGSRAQGVNDGPENNLNLLFFLYFICKLTETFKKLKLFTFGRK